MTPLLVLGNTVLAVVLLACSSLDLRLRQRVERVVAGVGVLSGVTLVLQRGGMSSWRGLEISADQAAIAGTAVACAWGLVLALDISPDRWWAGALVGVGSTSLLFFVFSAWTVPALMFLGCASAALSVTARRAGRAAWLSFAAADAALVAVLISDAVTRESWDAPSTLDGWLLAPLLISGAVRAGMVARLGPLGMLTTPAAAMGPLALAITLLSVSRWVEPPLPLASATVLLLALGVAAWSVLRRSFDPSVVGVWPVALAGALMLASAQASVPAAVSALLGLTVVILWPDAMERGRLSRGLSLSGMVPSVAFGALAITARTAFVHATGEGEPIQVAAWLTVSALLPAAFAAGVALGIFAARAEPEGGYQPEAVFMTWIMLGASIGAGVVLGADEVYGAIGGRPAVVLFLVAGTLGALAALRTGGGAPVDAAPSARVALSEPLELGGWAPSAALGLHVGLVGGIGWIAVKGLQVGFL